MRPVNTTVPAYCRCQKRPDRPWPWFYKNALSIHILVKGYENPGSPTVPAGNISPVWHNMDMLIGSLPAVITISGIICADEFFIHTGVLWIRGIINLSHREIPG